MVELPSSMNELENILAMSQGEFIQWLIQKRILQSEQNCNCGRKMSIQRVKTLPDEFCWKCCDSNCKKSKTIRAGSPFEGTQINLKTCLKIYSYWASEIPQCQIAQLTGIESKTINRLCSKFRIFANIWYDTNIHENPLGTTGVVQVDEKMWCNGRLR